MRGARVRSAVRSESRQVTVQLVCGRCRSWRGARQVSGDDLRCFVVDFALFAR
jgi:hypothetical protein